MTKAEFLSQERRAFLRFMYAAPDTMIGWSVTYTCDCGHVDRTPATAWEHTQECGRPKAGQAPLFGAP